MPRNEPALITLERAQSSDDFRAQVRFHIIEDKLIYALLHGHMSIFSPQRATASRDKWRAMILAQVIESSQACADDPVFRQSLRQFVNDKTGPEFKEQASAILAKLNLQ